MKTSEQKLSVEEFFVLAIKKLRVGGHKGIHSVYTDFNRAFREYFPGLDPVVESKKLAEQGKITVRLARGGAMLYLPDEAPPKVPDPLDIMGLT